MLAAVVAMLVFAPLDLLHECDNQMGNSNISDHKLKKKKFCQPRRCHLFCAMHAIFFRAFIPTRFEDATKPVSYFMVLFIWTLLTRFIEYWEISERVLSDHRLLLFVYPTFFLFLSILGIRVHRCFYDNGEMKWKPFNRKWLIQADWVRNGFVQIASYILTCTHKEREGNTRYEIDTALFNWKCY